MKGWGVVEINSSEEFEIWLTDKPQEWAQVLAKRTALRLLPEIADIVDQNDLPRDFKVELIYSTYRVCFISWVGWIQPTPNIITATASATALVAAESARAISEKAATATILASSAATTSAKGSTKTTVTAAAFAATVYPAADIWNGVNADIEFLQNSNDEPRTTARLLLGKKLWPSDQNGNSPPDWIQDSLHSLEENLTKFDDNWHVWIEWYRQILHGKLGWRLNPKNAEVLMVRIATQDIEFWEQGATLVNAEIAEWLAEFREEEKLNQLQPPEQALGANKAATGFIFENGKIDTVPPNAWENDLERAERIRESALRIAKKLHEQFLNSNAEPHLAANISVGMGVLMRPVSDIHPDELRLFAQSISAIARTYGHPNAEWELSAEAVENLFKFSTVLEDLQGIVKSDLQSNAEAIRALDIMPEHLEQAKSVNNDLQLAITALNPLFTKKAAKAYHNAAILSENALSQNVQIMIEGERILVTENLVLAIAREVAKSDAQSVFKSTRPPSDHFAEDGDWMTLVERFKDELAKDLPEELAKNLKKDPAKSIAYLGGVLIASVVALGPLITATSITAAAAWLTYLLRKKLRELDKANNEK